MQYVILLILGIIAIIISQICRKANNTRRELYKAQGTITKVIQSDTGEVRFFVDIPINKQIISAKSIFYSKTNKKYHAGDTVQLDYYYTDNNQVKVIIDDADLKPCRESFKSMSRVMLVAGLILIGMFVFFFVRSII